MNDTNTTSTGTWTQTAEYNVCPHKLPCGICRITNAQCPKFGWGCGPITYTGTAPHINLTDITCGTAEAHGHE